MKQRLLQSLLLLCGLIVGSVAWADTVTYGWEDADDADKWVITSVAKTSGEGKSGTYAGKINTNHSYVQFKDKVAVTSFSFALKRTSNNNNYNVYIETSTDGETWTAVETYKMSDFGNGSYTQKSKLFDGTTEYYVRFHCYNTTAVRYVDDVSITYSAGNEPPTCITPTFSPAAGTFASAQNVTISSETDGATIYYTVDGTEPTTESNVYSRAIPVNETTTIKAFAAKADYSNSAVASATYTIIALNHAGTAEDPYTVADALTYINALGSATSATEVYVSGIISQVDSYNDNYSSITYWISDDGTTGSQLEVYSGKGLDGAGFASVNDLKVGDIVTVKGYVKMFNKTPEFDKNNVLVSFERPVVTSPTLTVSKTSLTGFTYAEGCGPSVAQTFDLTGENLTGNVTLTLDNENFEISVSETNDYATSLTRPMSEFGSKTIYVRLKAGLDVNETYSGTITISSDGAEDKTVTLGGNVTVYVPDYATLPFAFNDGKAKIESTVGLTQNGLGSDYSSTNAPTTQLKFDTTGDYMILKLNEAAGTLAFDIKGNSFSNSTFTVQTSSDGLSYRNLMVYTELEGTQTVALALAPDVRFIKWIYTEKASGNVGLGNIKVVDWAEIVSVNEARYATYVPKHDVIFPDGVEAYIGTINKKYVSLTAVKSAPKDTPVILKNTGRYTLIPVTEETLDDVSGNDLSASDKDVEATGSQYILAKPEGEEVGFYPAITGTTIPAGKAYLVSNETGHLVKAFYFVGEGETAIGSIQNSNFEIQNGEVYNLAGQRISKMQKGVNIINGYKVLR